MSPPVVGTPSVWRFTLVLRWRNIRFRGGSDSWLSQLRWDGVDLWGASPKEINIYGTCINQVVMVSILVAPITVVIHWPWLEPIEVFIHRPLVEPIEVFLQWAMVSEVTVSKFGQATVGRHLHH